MIFYFVVLVVSTSLVLLITRGVSQPIPGILDRNYGGAIILMFVVLIPWESERIYSLFYVAGGGCEPNICHDNSCRNIGNYLFYLKKIFNKFEL